MPGKTFVIAALTLLLGVSTPERAAVTGPKETSVALPPTDYMPYKPGEVLTYDLNFGEIHAGQTTMEIAPELKEIAGRKHYHISITGKSYKSFDVFYKVRDYFETFIDENTLLPSIFIRDISEGDYKKKEHYLFNQNTHKVKSGGRIFNVEPQMHDLVSVFYYLRCIDFSKQPVGKDIPFEVFFDNEVMPVGIKYTGKETIKTNFGKIRCYVFVPKLVQGRIFVGQSDMKIYVSEDKNQIPVRIQSAISLGYVRADLLKYTGLKFPFTARAE